jgi:hypothetical protein
MSQRTFPGPRRAEQNEGCSFVIKASVCLCARRSPALQDRFLSFAEAFNRADAAAVAKHYTDDAAVFPPESARIDGRADPRFVPFAVMQGTPAAQKVIADVLGFSRFVLVD